MSTIDPNEQIQTQILSQSQPFTKELLNFLLSDGFGAKTKRELEIFIFHLMDKYGDLADFSKMNQSRLLEISTAKIDNLRYDAQLKHDKRDDATMRQKVFDWLSKREVRLEGEKIKISVDDKSIREYLEQAVLEKRGFIDGSFRSSIISVDKSLLEDILDEWLVSEPLQQELKKLWRTKIKTSESGTTNSRLKHLLEALSNFSSSAKFLSKFLELVRS